LCYTVPMQYINLSGKHGKGHQTKVDDSTFTKYGHLTWHLSDTGYAVRRNRSEGGTVRLHRLVVDAPEGKVVDHLNGDKLDNQLSNLRVCTQKENTNNRKSTVGYCWDKSKQKWIVRYKHQFYGRYDTEEEARKAYQLACSGVPYKKREHRQMYHLPTGVFKNRTNKGYQARAQINGKRVYLGTFATIKEAEKAYLDRKRG
jgi:HNH endonuclease